MTRTRHQSQVDHEHELDHEQEQDELMSAPARSATGTQPANTGATPAATATAPGIDGPGE